MQLGGGVPNQVRGCHPCECLSYSPTTCAHGLVPKSPQLSRQVIQVLLGVGSGSSKFLSSQRSEQDQLVGGHPPTHLIHDWFPHYPTVVKWSETCMPAGSPWRAQVGKKKIEGEPEGSLGGVRCQTVRCNGTVWWYGGTVHRTHRTSAPYHFSVPKISLWKVQNWLSKLQNWWSESESELAGPKAAPLGRKQKQFKICRSSIMQGENYKIPLH